MSDDYLFTTESVSEGDPDQVADQISDAVLHALLARPCNPVLTKGDCELTCRKIIDGQAAYAARHFAKNIIAAALPEDGRIRQFWPRTAGIHLGTHR